MRWFFHKHDILRCSQIAMLIAVCCFFVGIQASAQDTPPAETPYTTEAYVQGCEECHIDVVADWQDSDHAMTFHTEAFQSAIADGADDSCYACHTTGYTAFNGEYHYEGITCEACHGLTPENHPDEPISVEPGLNICADCHATTYHEWEMSAHGNAEMPCTSCHNPHEQALRFGNAEALCLNCHGDEERTDYVHVSHETEDCVSCHWHKGMFDAETHLVTGELFPSGHEAQVETVSCIECHSELDDDALIDGDGDTDADVAPSGLDVRVQFQELSAELDNVRAQGENLSAVRLMQGIVVGLAFGAVIATLFARLRPGQALQEADDE